MAYGNFASLRNTSTLGSRAAPPTPKNFKHPPKVCLSLRPIVRLINFLMIGLPYKWAILGFEEIFGSTEDLYIFSINNGTDNMICGRIFFNAGNSILAAGALPR